MTLVILILLLTATLELAFLIAAAIKQQQTLTAIQKLLQSEQPPTNPAVALKITLGTPVNQ